MIQKGTVHAGIVWSYHHNILHSSSVTDLSLHANVEKTSSHKYHFLSLREKKHPKKHTWCWEIKWKWCMKQRRKITFSRIYLKVLPLFACLQGVFVPCFEHNASNRHMEYVLHLLKGHWARNWMYGWNLKQPNEKVYIKNTPVWLLWAVSFQMKSDRDSSSWELLYVRRDHKDY